MRSCVAIRITFGFFAALTAAGCSAPADSGGTATTRSEIALPAPAPSPATAQQLLDSVHRDASGRLVSLAGPVEMVDHLPASKLPPSHAGTIRAEARCSGWCDGNVCCVQCGEPARCGQM